MKNKEVITWQDEKASERFAMISPLLSDGLDPAKRCQIRSQIAENNDVSERTLYRLEAAWRKSGFSGLRPMNREMRRSQKLPDNFDEIVAEAIQLKKEVPTRSVARIILILEMEGWVSPGVLKRSTLQRYLYRAGLGVKQMKRYTEARNATSRRFCKPHRMMLVQCDIKYGLKLPIGEGGKKIQTYLSALIDDHSRFVLESGWYDNQEAVIVEDTFHKAILKRGIMDSVYADNGKQYVSVNLTRALERLGVRYMHAKPYHAWSKGLVERFNSSVDSFLEEVKLKNVKSLEELNSYWQAWWRNTTTTNRMTASANTTKVWGYLSRRAASHLPRNGTGTAVPLSFLTAALSPKPSCIMSRGKSINPAACPSAEGSTTSVSPLPVRRLRSHMIRWRRKQLPSHAKALPRSPRSRLRSLSFVTGVLPGLPVCRKKSRKHPVSWMDSGNRPRKPGSTV